MSGGRLAAYRADSMPGVSRATQRWWSWWRQPDQFVRMTWFLRDHGMVRSTQNIMAFVAFSSALVPSSIFLSFGAPALATVLVCAGSDGQGAVKQIQRIATGWRLTEMAPPHIVCTHAQTPERILASKTINRADLQRCHELGAAFASGLAMGLF